MSPTTGLGSPTTVQRSDRAAEDCRDFLRTGRCKYGGSCKYNHPPYVQSGGGMKAPIDPTEPLFPVRPHEPPCPYYIKHGTCKFGQACKFNHPPNMAGGGGGGPPVVQRRVDTAPHMILNPVAADGSSAMMLQFLPQRPEEADCIYFLKNGRCKYGATCRYHHPINGSFQHRRQEEARRVGRATGTTDQYGNKIHYVNQGHFGPGMVSDGPVAFVSVDGSQTLAPVSFLQSNDGAAYCVPVGTTVATDQGSSASSIASSHDTSGSALEYFSLAGSRRNGSGGSLNAYVVDQGRVRNRIPNSASDGNIARRVRAVSQGSDTGHYEAISHPETAAWRPPRSSSFDHSRRPTPAHGEYSPRSPSLHGRPPPPRASGPRMVQQRPNHGHGDEGFTMMASALLNMLDTPEETSAEVYNEDGTYHYAIDDDSSRLLQGLSLGPQDNGAAIPGSDYDGSRWSPGWQRSDMVAQQGQSMVHPYAQSQPSALHHNRMQFSQPHASPSAAEHHADFGQYLP
jgi:hypothetical protein